MTAKLRWKDSIIDDFNKLRNHDIWATSPIDRAYWNNIITQAKGSKFLQSKVECISEGSVIDDFNKPGNGETW